MAESDSSDKFSIFERSLMDVLESGTSSEIMSIGPDNLFVEFTEAINWIAFGTFSHPGMGPQWFTIWTDSRPFERDWFVSAEGKQELARHQLVTALKSQEGLVWGVINDEEFVQRSDESDLEFSHRRTVQIPSTLLEQIEEQAEPGISFVGDVTFECLFIRHDWLTGQFQPGPSMLVDRVETSTKADVDEPSRTIEYLNSPRRGRPAKWDWDWLKLEIIALANSPDGLPDKQADLEVWAAELFAKKYGNEPSSSLIRKHVGPIYRRIRQ